MQRILTRGIRDREIEVEFELDGEPGEPDVGYDGWVAVCDVRVTRFGKWHRDADNEHHFLRLDEMATAELTDEIDDIIDDEFGQY